MILKEEYLIKRNNKNRIQVVLMQLDNTPSKDVYTILRTIYQFDGKKQKLKNLVIDTGELGSSVSEKALQVFSKYRNKYKRMGYILLPQISSRKYHSLTEEELQKIITRSDKKFVEQLPLPMEPKNYNSCSPDVIETDCYCTQNVEGIRCFVYYQNNTIKIHSRAVKSLSKVNESIRSNECLLKWFETNPKLVLDCFLYKQGQSLKAIIDTISNGMGELQLLVYDIVSDENFDKRLEQLEQLQASNNVVVMQYTKLAGWLKIEKFYKNSVNQGFPGIIIKFPNRPYGSGKRSAYYMLLMKFYQEDTFTLTNVTKDGFNLSDTNFTVNTKLGQAFKCRAFGTPQELENWLTNKNNYIGKKITCMFEYYTKDGIPVNPAFKCFN